MSGTHSLIKPCGIRVGGNFNLRDVLPSGYLHCMNEEFFTHTCADVFGCDPQMFEFGLLVSNNEGIETDDLAVPVREIDLIVADEIWRYGEVGLPVLNPMLRVAPMPLGIMSDFRKRGRFFRQCPSYSHELSRYDCESAGAL